MDDVVSGSGDVESAFQLYLKSRLRLAVAGFKLRKFVTNSDVLRHHIQKSESTPGSGETEENYLLPVVGGSEEPVHAEEDQSYAKSSLGAKVDEKPGLHKVLGVQWSVARDEFCFGIGEVAHTMEDLEPTKRNAVSVTAKFFDPLGVVSPVTILFKIFCQQLCEVKVAWDEPLTGSLLARWDRLLVMLRNAEDIVVPRCLFCDTIQPTCSARWVL